MAASDHPLSHAKPDNRPLDLAELADYPVILPDLATYTGRIVAGLFESEQIPLTATLSTNYLETISMLVSIGLGWSVLPSSLTADLTILETTGPGDRPGARLGDQSTANAVERRQRLH